MAAPFHRTRIMSPEILRVSSYKHCLQSRLRLRNSFLGEGAEAAVQRTHGLDTPEDRFNSGIRGRSGEIDVEAEFEVASRDGSAFDLEHIDVCPGKFIQYGGECTGPVLHGENN